MIEEGLTTWLKANIALVANRVYDDALPQNPTLPAITYFKVSGVRVHSHNGPSHLAHPRIQVNCWGTTRSAASHLAEEVRQDMDCYSGAMGAETIQVALLANEYWFYYPDTKLYNTALDFIIWHTES